MPDMSVKDLKPKKCFKCKKELNEDYFCSGCQDYICDECDVNYNIPFGGHPKELHLVEPIDD